jgi:hypothetical protein
VSYRQRVWEGEIYQETVGANGRMAAFFSDSAIVEISLLLIFF